MFNKQGKQYYISPWQHELHTGRSNINTGFKNAKQIKNTKIYSWELRVIFRCLIKALSTFRQLPMAQRHLKSYVNSSRKWASLKSCTVNVIWEYGNQLWVGGMKMQYWTWRKRVSSFLWLFNLTLELLAKRMK